VELAFALATAIVGIVIIWKLLKGAARTLGLLVVAAVVGFFVVSNGGFA
jgi:hypothetical protein